MNNPMQLGVVEHLRGESLRILAFTLIAAFVVGGCGLADSGEERPYRSAAKEGPKESKEVQNEGDECPSPVSCISERDIEKFQSLAITDPELLEPFTFERVMNQIIVTSGAEITKLELFRRWWDTQNDSAGGIYNDVRHCDSTSGSDLNSMTMSCPRPEGLLADDDPFAFLPDANGEQSNPESYIPIALTNRFDLAPTDGAHCGEYRIVFARRSGLNSPFDRNLLIFEGRLPNPNPQCGANACLPIAHFWQQQSDIKSKRARKNRLEAFYFEGYEDFPPVVHADHYGPTGGQIRTNQFFVRSTLPFPVDDWQLREFKVDNECGVLGDEWAFYTGQCNVKIKQVTVKSNPHGKLFAESTPAFEQYFISQLENLATPHLKRFFMVDNDQFNANDSSEPFFGCPPPGSEPRFPVPEDTCYEYWLGQNPEFKSRLAEATANLAVNVDADPNNDVSADDLVRRADTLSCAGCHQNIQGVGLGGADEHGAEIFIPTKVNGGDRDREFGFVHVTERVTDQNGHFRLSPVLEDVYLEHRKEVMADFMCKGDKLHAGKPGADGTAPSKLRGEFETLGGPKRVH